MLNILTKLIMTFFAGTIFFFGGYGLYALFGWLYDVGEFQPQTMICCFATFFNGLLTYSVMIMIGKTYKNKDD